MARACTRAGPAVPCSHRRGRHGFIQVRPRPHDTPISLPASTAQPESDPPRLSVPPGRSRQIRARSVLPPRTIPAPGSSPPHGHARFPPRDHRTLLIFARVCAGRGTHTRCTHLAFASRGSGGQEGQRGDHLDVGLTDLRDECRAFGTRFAAGG